jgi:hypothetical protein
MDYQAQETLLEFLIGLRPVALFGVLFCISCTGWLVISRIRGVFHPRRSRPFRDAAFLATGPVIAILVSFIKAAEVAEMFMGSGIDTGAVFRHNLHEAVAMCLVGFWCFIAGLSSAILPSKPNANLA